jgi:hypothetical protein
VPTSKQRKTVPVMTPEQFLSGYPVEVQILATELRTLIKNTIPVQEERVAFGWRLIGYRVANQQKTVYVCAIVPKEDRADLYFENGVLMNDPEHRLQAGANMKQVRYVPLRTVAEIVPEALAPLLHEAVRVSITKA